VLSKPLKEVAIQKHVRIRILVHITNEIREILSELKSSANIEFRNLQDSLQTRLTTLVIDGKFSLEVEVKDDTKESSSEAIGLASYSNSESRVWTHTSIFETLWIQAELQYERQIDQKVS
jgi:hypothetical protein